MAATRTFRPADAVLVLLVFLMPVMLLGGVQDRAGHPTMLFWILLLLPIFGLIWLLTCCDPEERGNGHRAAAVKVRPGWPALSGVEGSKAVAFADIVSPIVRPVRYAVEDGVPVVEGDPLVPRATVFPELERRLAVYGVSPLVESLDDHTVRVVGLPAAVGDRLGMRSSTWVNVALLVATICTTVYAGAWQQGINLFLDPGAFAVGLPYAFTLLTILGIHELGHYFMAKYHGVDVTPPYFIPVPMGLGTFGAFIQIKSLIKTRRAVFDIGIAGPLAGLVVALPLLYIGLQQAMPIPDPGAGVGTASLLFALVARAAQGGELGQAVVTLSPVAFAAWIGIFVTALNLVPVGQLDGGHIAYALFGRKHAQTISILTVLGMAVAGMLAWPGLLTWALLIMLMAGFSHMPALDDLTPPDFKRYVLGALSFVIFLLIVLPAPGSARSALRGAPPETAVVPYVR
jgi:membrane-associated protease RseP (regulator of RpoE activity)